MTSHSKLLRKTTRLAVGTLLMRFCLKKRLHKRLPHNTSEKRSIFFATSKKISTSVKWLGNFSARIQFGTFGGRQKNLTLEKHLKFSNKSSQHKIFFFQPKFFFFFFVTKIFFHFFSPRFFFRKNPKYFSFLFLQSPFFVPKKVQNSKLALKFSFHKMRLCFPRFFYRNFYFPLRKFFFWGEGLSPFFLTCHEHNSKEPTSAPPR